MKLLKTLDLIVETIVLLAMAAVVFCFPVLGGIILMSHLEERFYIVKELQGLQLLAITIHGIVVFTVWFYFAGWLN